MMELRRRYEEDERSLWALFRFTKEQIQDIPYQAAIDNMKRSSYVCVKSVSVIFLNIYSLHGIKGKNNHIEALCFTHTYARSLNKTCT